MNDFSVSKPSWSTIGDDARRSDYFSWLSERGSLVKKLSEASGVDCVVRPVYEAWASIWPDEAAYLSVPLDELVWVREVQHSCGDQVVVFARSIFPKALLDADSRFQNMGPRGIGAVVFNDPHIKRGDVEVAMIDQSHALYQRMMRIIKQPIKSAWARRSIFHIATHKVLVCEVLLPSVTTL